MVGNGGGGTGSLGFLAAVSGEVTTRGSGYRGRHGERGRTRRLTTKPGTGNKETEESFGRHGERWHTRRLTTKPGTGNKETKESFGRHGERGS